MFGLHKNPSLEKDWQSSEWQNKNIRKWCRSANTFCSCRVEDLKFVCSKTPGSMLGNAYRIGGWLFTFVEDAVLTWSLLLHSAWIRMRWLVGWRLARRCPSQLSFKVLTSLIIFPLNIVGAMVVIAEVLLLSFIFIYNFILWNLITVENPDESESCRTTLFVFWAQYIESAMYKNINLDHASKGLVFIRNSLQYG